MIFQLVYTSDATREFWPDDLLHLVERARTKNADRDITGMLLFRENQFLQLLEGREPTVRGVFSVISHDPRHTNLRVLLTESVPARAFPTWTMGFERLEEAWNLPRSWATILEQEVTPSADYQPGSAAKALLISFGQGFTTSSSTAGSKS